MNKKDFAFDRINFILLAIGMAVVIVGFIHFDPAIFDARRIKVAPLVCLAGYVFMIYAIVRAPKDKHDALSENQETKTEG